MSQDNKTYRTRAEAETAAIRFTQSYKRKYGVALLAIVVFPPPPVTELVIERIGYDPVDDDEEIPF